MAFVDRGMKKYMGFSKPKKKNTQSAAAQKILQMHVMAKALAGDGRLERPAPGDYTNAGKYMPPRRMFEDGSAESRYPMDTRAGAAPTMNTDGPMAMGGGGPLINMLQANSAQTYGMERPAPGEGAAQNIPPEILMQILQAMKNRGKLR